MSCLVEASTERGKKDVVIDKGRRQRGIEKEILVYEEKRQGHGREVIDLEEGG